MSHLKKTFFYSIVYIIFNLTKKTMTAFGLFLMGCYYMFWGLYYILIDTPKTYFKRNPSSIVIVILVAIIIYLLI